MDSLATAIRPNRSAVSRTSSDFIIVRCAVAVAEHQYMRSVSSFVNYSEPKLARFVTRKIKGQISEPTSAAELNIC
jgi:hypothetical protein